MAADPGGFLSFIPCVYLCCLRRRPENLAADSEENLAPNDPSSKDGEDDKINCNQSGYGAVDKQDADVGTVDEDQPSWNDIATRYSTSSQPVESDEEKEEEEAYTKPLESLSLAEPLKEEDVLCELESNLACVSVVSSTGSNVDVPVLEEAASVRSDAGSPDNMSPALQRKVDTSSVDGWSTPSKSGSRDPSLILRGSVDSLPSRRGNVTPPVHSMPGDTASMESWTSRTEVTPSIQSLQAESSVVKSWSKGETENLEKQQVIASDPESCGGSLEDITEKSVENKITDKSFSYEELKSLPELDVVATTEEPVYSVPQKEKYPEPEPVPDIEIDSSYLASESLRSKCSDDSGVVMEKYKSLGPPTTSQSAIFSDELESDGMRKSASMVSLDSTGHTKKKKKKRNFFKKLHFKKKKKKSNLEVQQEHGVSVSTPSLAHTQLSDQSNLSMKSRFSASVLLASLDDLSDDDICKE